MLSFMNYRSIWVKTTTNQSTLIKGTHTYTTMENKRAGDVKAKEDLVSMNQVGHEVEFGMMFLGVHYLMKIFSVI